MRPSLHRGKAPAPGILYAPQRMKAETVIGASGKPETVPDPRGYWLGQREGVANPLSRRDMHRIVALARKRHTKPDFTAQIAQEKKAERSRKSRAKAARGRS